jgi:hypothetical protein
MYLTLNCHKFKLLVQYVYTNIIAVVLRFLFPGDFKVYEGLCGTLHDVSSSCSTQVARCAVNATYKNKKVGDLLNLFHKYLGASLPLVVFLLLLSVILVMSFVGGPLE